MSAVARFLDRLEGVKRSGDGWEAKCPAHDDRHASLSVNVGDDGRVLVKCHAGEGCSTEQIVAAVRLGLADLFERSSGDGDGRRIVATYDYEDEHGTLLFQAVRYEPKAFMQRRPDGRGGWIYRTKDVRRVLYRLPQVLDAVKAGRIVYVVEGEKGVQALEAAGEVATCNPMGAGKWRAEFSKTLSGAAVVIVQDRDEEGTRHATAVERALAGVAACVQIVEAAEGKDAYDHLKTGRGVDEFAPVKTSAPAPTEMVAAGPGDDLLEELLAFVRRFVVMSDAEAVVVALWVLHTYTVEAFDVTPYLHVTAPTKRAGKSRLLEVLAALVHKPLRAGGATEAALFRGIADRNPTLLFDEVDAIFGPKARDHEDLRALFNNGYQRGTPVLRCVGEGSKQVATEFAVYCAKALSGIGRLPDTIADRSLPIVLKRKARHEQVERFRLSRTPAEAAPLRARLEAWAAEHLEALRVATPDLPAELDDRAQDVAEPLLAVADLAGGDWPVRAARRW